MRKVNIFVQTVTLVLVGYFGMIIHGSPRLRILTRYSTTHVTHATLSRLHFVSVPLLSIILMSLACVLFIGLTKKNVGSILRAAVHSTAALLLAIVINLWAGALFQNQ